MKISALISSAIIIWGMSQAAYTQTFSSSAQQVNLIELYTSEGCSSCPPADKWLNDLKDQKGLWSEFIPLAFHVDYWDYIGWQDPFADSRHSQRQYRYQATDNIRSVYTPAVVINGNEWRAWRRDILPKNQNSNAGKLKIELEKNQLSARYQADIPLNQSLVLNIAILGFDLTSKVNKGENSGRTLKHEFVVLAYRAIAMQPSQAGFNTNNVILPSTSVNSRQTALATWVSTPKNPTPLQATGGWLN
jgi:hypothetical protein